VPPVPTRDRRQFQKAGSQPAPVQEDQPAVSPSTVDELPDPLEPVASEPLTQAYVKPQPVAEPAGPETGTTGGLVPQQAGTWDKPVVAPRLSDDPTQRAKQSTDAAQAEFEAKQRAVNPHLFSGAVKSLAKVGGKKYQEQAIREGDQLYTDQVQADRAAIIGQRRDEMATVKAENAKREAQFRGTGQQFYTDPYGRIQPVIDPQGRKLYSATAWEEGAHPKTGAPVLQKRDQFGQRQFKTPPIVASPDLTDDQLYYKFGDDDLRPAGKVEDLVNHPDFTIARTAKRVSAQRRKAIWSEAIAPMEAVKADTEVAYDMGQQRAIELQAQIEQLTTQAAAYTPEMLEQTQGGVFGIGATPTPAAAQAQQAKAGIDAQLGALLTEQAALTDSLKPMGQLGRTKRAAALDLAMFKAKAAHESYADLADERRMILRQQGKSEEDDPTLKSILEAQATYGTQLQRAASMAEREALAASQASRADVPPPAPVAPVVEEAEGALSKTAKSFTRGALSEGLYAASEGLARLMEGVGASGWVPGFGVAPAGMEGAAKWYGDATRQLRENIRKALPVDQQFAQSKLGQISQGLGQAAGTLPTAVLGPAGLAAASIGQIYTEAYDDAKASGASDADAHMAAVQYLPASGVDFLSDRLIIGKILKPLVGKMKVGQILRDVLTTTAVEGGTEGAQQAYLNFIASKLQAYDPDRPLDKEVLDSIIVGAAVGGTVTGAGQAAGSLLAPGETPPAAPPPPDAPGRTSPVSPPPAPEGTVGGAGDKSEMQLAEEELQRRLAASDLSPAERAEFDRLRNEEAEPIGPTPGPSTAEQAAEVLVPELAEKRNTPPPARSAAESAAVFQEADAQQAQSAEELSRKEGVIQNLVDQISGGNDRLRTGLLNRRKGLTEDQFIEALQGVLLRQRPGRSDVEAGVREEATRIANSPIDGDTPGVENVGRIPPAELDVMSDAGAETLAERTAASLAGVTQEEIATRRAGQAMVGPGAEPVVAGEAPALNFDEDTTTATPEPAVAAPEVQASQPAQTQPDVPAREEVADAGPERIVKAAVRFSDGEVRTGTNHAEIVGAIGDRDMRGSDDGFVTSTGRYVSREEAMKIARDNGQTTGKQDGLTAERLEYDRLRGEMKPEKFGTPEYQAAWQASEDIKNRNKGMPPGEVAAEVVPEKPAPKPVREEKAKPATDERVGKIVRYKVAGPSGDMTVAGTVQQVYSNGRLEVKRQQGGYDVIDATDVLDKSDKSKVEVSGLFARTAPKPRSDIENGTRYTEWRTRKITNEDLRNETIAREAGKDDFLVERRSVSTDGQKVEPGEWQPMATGTTKREAIESAWESGMDKATSFDVDHKKLVDESAERVKSLQDAEASKKENQEKARALHSEYLAAVDAVPIKGKNGEINLSWSEGNGKVGTKTVPAMIYGDWAVYKAQQGRGNVYNVTHVASGKRATFMNTAGEAKRIVQAIIQSGADAKKIDSDPAELAKVAKAIMGVRTSQTPPWFSAKPPAKAPAPISAAVTESTPESVEGDKINKEWTAFDKESGTLGIPRAEMPQIKSEARGALVNFLKARGIEAKAGMINPSKLKPTQAEFSPAKVQKARDFTGSERPILISSDNHVVDGHHQWVASLDDTSTPMPVIRLNAPIDRVLAEVKEFPSSEQAAGAAVKGEAKPAAKVQAAAPALSTRAIEALQKAKIDTKGKVYDATAGVPIAAYNAALDIAILGIRAGRALADVIKLAVARYRAKHPKATAEEVAKLTAAINDAYANPPEPPKPSTAKSAVPPSLREGDVPAADIEYDVRNQDERMKEARAMIDRDGATTAEQKLSDRSLPADTRVAIGGVLLEKKMNQLRDAKAEDVAKITADINRITAAVRAGVSTESGQGVAMHNRIYKNLGVMSAMEYARDVNTKRVEAMGGEDANKAADEAAKVFNGTKDQAARDKAIEKLKERYTSKPVRKMLNSLQGLEVAQKLNELGVLRRDDMIDIAANELGLPGIEPKKLHQIADLVDRIENADSLADAELAQLELTDTLANFRGTSKVDLETSLMTLNVLFSTNTQIANAGGNAFRLITELASVAGVNPTAERQKALWEGFKGGLPIGWAQAKSIWETGRSTRDLQDKTIGVGSAVERADYRELYPNMPKAIANALNAKKDVLARVGRFMRAMDALAYYPAREAYARMVATKFFEGSMKGEALQKKVAEILHTTPGELEAARKQAEAEGYNGVAVARRASEIIEARRGETPEGAAAAKEAEAFGADTTYTNEPVGNAGVVYRAASNVAQRFRIGGVPVLKPWMMFLRTPTNMFNASLDYTPIGAVRAMKGSIRDQAGNQKDFTQDEINRKYFQAAVGTSLMAGTTLAIAKGLMDVTFKGPDDPEKRRQLQAAGWRPYSFRIGQGPYMSYRDTPMIVPLAVVGYVADAAKYNTDKKSQFLESRVADALLNAPFQAAFATSPLTGMADLLGAANGQGSLARGLTSVPANLAIPGSRLLMEMDRYLDPKVYDSNPLKQTVPFLRRDGTARSDVQGRSVETVPIDRFGGFPSKDPVDKLLVEKKVFIPGISETLKVGKGPAQRDMTDEEKEAYKRVSGQRIRARLQAITPRLRSMDQGAAQDEIDRITREERARVKPLIGITIKK